MVPLNFRVKINENCVRTCAYCYQKGDLQVVNELDNSQYSDVQLTRLQNTLIKYIVSSKATRRPIKIILFGGEPSLSVAKCSQVIEICDAVLSKYSYTKNETYDISMITAALVIPVVHDTLYTLEDRVKGYMYSLDGVALTTDSPTYFEKYKLLDAEALTANKYLSKDYLSISSLLNRTTFPNLIALIDFLFKQSEFENIQMLIDIDKYGQMSNISMEQMCILQEKIFQTKSKINYIGTFIPFMFNTYKVGYPFTGTGGCAMSSAEVFYSMERDELTCCDFYRLKTGDGVLDRRKNILNQVQERHKIIIRSAVERCYSCTVKKGCIGLCALNDTDKRAELCEMRKELINGRRVSE